MISKKTLMAHPPSQDKIQNPVLPFLPSPATLQQHWPALGVFNIPICPLSYGLCTHSLFLGAASLTLPFLPPVGPWSYAISHTGTQQTPKVSSGKMQKHEGSDLFSPSPLLCCCLLFFSQYLFICLVASGLSCGTQIFIASLHSFFHCGAQILIVTHKLLAVAQGQQPHAKQNINAPTRDQTRGPCIARWILNLWTPRAVPSLLLSQITTPGHLCLRRRHLTCLPAYAHCLL